MYECEINVYTQNGGMANERKRKEKDPYSEPVTLIYDDLSWEAPDLKLCPERSAEFQAYHVGVAEYKGTLDGRDIRRRFRAVVDDFESFMHRVNSSRVPRPEFSFIHSRDTPYKLDLVPLSKFIKSIEGIPRTRMHLTLPLNPVFVSLNFVDVVENGDEFMPAGVYSSAATIALIKETAETIMGTDSTFNPWGSDHSARIAVFGLTTIGAEKFDQRQFSDLVYEFKAQQSRMINSIPGAAGTFLYTDSLLFTESKNPDCIEYNRLSVDRAIGDIRFPNYHQNVNEAHALRQIITHGLASNSTSPEWSHFLIGNNLYDPRLWLHVWDLINRSPDTDDKQ